jgi:DNA-binding SARP family transcriptional activator
MMVRLSLFGAVDLRGTDGEELRAVLGQPKRLALLTYLAIAHPSGLHSRDTLLALLWPELNQEHGRAALRQAVYVLRQALGNAIMVTCGDNVIGLDHRHLWCDVRAFNCALDQGNNANGLALYGGELLAGFHVTGAPEFERWLDWHRTGLQTRAAKAGFALFQNAKRRGDLNEALEWAFSLLRIQQDDERMVREVIALHNQLGDRIAALRLYRDFSRRIAVEYGVDPAPETQAMVSDILSDGARAVPAKLAQS